MIRTIIFFIVVAAALIISIPFCLISFIRYGKDPYAPFPKSAKFITKKIVPFFAKLGGCNYKIEGEENLPEGPAMFVGNHQGLFDAFLILFAFERIPVIMAKIEAKKIPLVNLWMKLIHTIFIERGNLRQSLQCIKDAESYLEKGFSFAVFPEGTRSRGPEMGEFKPGIFKVAAKTKAAIVPFAIDGSYKVHEQHTLLKKADVTLKILKPISVEGSEKTQELADRAKSAIQEALNDIREKEHE